MSVVFLTSVLFGHFRNPAKSCGEIACRVAWWPAVVQGEEPKA
jgi:hypothetical protein